LQALVQLQKQGQVHQKLVQEQAHRTIHQLVLAQEQLQKEARVLQQVVQTLMAQEQVHQIIHQLVQEQVQQINLPPELLLAVQMQVLVEEQLRILQILQLRVQQDQPLVLSFLCYQQHSLPNEVPQMISAQIVAFPL